MGSLTVGAGPGADIILADDGYMSAVHCKITDYVGVITIQDMGSTNGTWIIHADGNRTRVYGPVCLRRGDRIRIGRTTLPWEVQ